MFISKMCIEYNKFGVRLACQTKKLDKFGKKPITKTTIGLAANSYPAQRQAAGVA